MSSDLTKNFYGVLLTHVYVETNGNTERLSSIEGRGNL